MCTTLIQRRSNVFDGLQVYKKREETDGLQKTLIWGITTQTMLAF